MSRPLTIAIDARELAGRPTGVGTYVAGVLRVWAESTFPHRLQLLSHAPMADDTVPPALGADVRVEPAAVGGTWWEQTVLPRLVRESGADVLLAPAYTAPLRLGTPTVLIVHDVSFFAQPSGYRWREGLRRRVITRASARRARRVLTDSAFSAREIVRYLGVAPERVTVAAQGAPAWTGDAHATSPHVLSVGTLFNRRHVPELLEAFASVVARVPDATLTIVGQNQTQPPIDPLALAAALGIGNCVRWRPYVSTAELDDLYRSARAFAFLSDYEGFGMTPMEAAARGVPSVVLDTEVAREVYGAGALRVPLAVPAIADALCTLLTDDQVHADTCALARERLAAFPWARTAEIVRAALEQAAS
ncbi:MAG: hypothetical protein AMXMBFR57_34650 [Acidimicrobiia bacterium]